MKNLKNLSEIIGYKELFKQIREQAKMEMKNLYSIKKPIIILGLMFFFSLLIFTTEYLPFNEEAVVICCIFFAFLCIDIFASNFFKDYLVEHINDIINSADKNMEEVKAILAVKGAQEIKCNDSLKRKKIFLYNLFLKTFTINDFFFEALDPLEVNNQNNHN